MTVIELAPRLMGRAVPAQIAAAAAARHPAALADPGVPLKSLLRVPARV